MYIQEITIDIKTKADHDEVMDEFGSLMASYRANGQTQGRNESLYIAKGRIVCSAYTLEKNALSKKFNNLFVKKNIEKVEGLCNSKLTFRTVGKSYESYKGPCKCKKSDFYILFTHFITITSPLICGTCDKPVPLYRLPKFDVYEYWKILSWVDNYVSCDRLQINCQIGERWALNQMEEITSQLSKQGLEICRKIEELTSIPTYYFLFNYKKFKGDQLTRPCPSCGKKWGLKSTLHKLYDFKCDNCRIVSTISPNS